jgi:hypothetical protein
MTKDCNCRDQIKLRAVVALATEPVALASD